MKSSIILPFFGIFRRLFAEKGNIVPMSDANGQEIRLAAGHEET
jgi:hypothetical protein